MTNSKTRASRPGAKDIVSLADLVPAHDVKGGGARRVFGADALPAPVPGRQGERPDSKRGQSTGLPRLPDRKAR